MAIRAPHLLIVPLLLLLVLMVSPGKKLLNAPIPLILSPPVSVCFIAPLPLSFSTSLYGAFPAIFFLYKSSSDAAVIFFARRKLEVSIFFSESQFPPQKSKSNSQSLHFLI